MEALLRTFDVSFVQQLQRQEQEAQAPQRLTAEDFQVSLSVDRLRVPEILFEPMALIGVDQAGVGEVMERVVNQYSPSVQEEICKVCSASGCGFVHARNSHESVPECVHHRRGLEAARLPGPD